MDNVDLNVLRQVAQWQASGHRVVLGTVVRTWGSSPRPPGSLMVVRDDGAVAGSVSGGCSGSAAGTNSATVPVTCTSAPTAAAAGGAELVNTRMPSDVAGSASTVASGS